MQTKICSRCKTERPVSEFNKQKCRKDGLNPTCIPCRKIYREENRERLKAISKKYYHEHKEESALKSKAYREENRERVLAKKREYAKKHREQDRERAKKHYYDNKEKKIEQITAWQKNNKDKIKKYRRKWRVENNGKQNATSRKRQAAKLQRTPPWMEEDLIALVYEHCERLNELWGTNFEVDHFIPLQGEDVSGLHCWDNLQLLDRSLNASKNNRNPLCPTDF